MQTTNKITKRTFGGVEFEVVKFYDKESGMWEEWVTPRQTICPDCGSEALVSIHFMFEKDTLAFSCPKCGIFAWYGGLNKVPLTIGEHGRITESR